MEKKGPYYHHDGGSGGIADWHNSLHSAVSSHIVTAASVTDPEAKKHVIQAFIADLSQLRISANLLGADGENHREEALTNINIYFTDGQKLS